MKHKILRIGTLTSLIAFPIIVVSCGDKQFITTKKGVKIRESSIQRIEFKGYDKQNNVWMIEILYKGVPISYATTSRHSLTKEEYNYWKEKFG